jgi:hypothetical protein
VLEGFCEHLGCLNVGKEIQCRVNRNDDKRITNLHRIIGVYLTRFRAFGYDAKITIVSERESTPAGKY